MRIRLVYEDKEKNCHIVAPCDRFQQPTEGDAEAIARLHSLAIPDVTEFIACNPENIPQDLTFRKAWEKGDVRNPIKISLQKSLEIHRERLKEACKKKIEVLNEELEIAEENQNIPQQVSINRTKKIIRTLHEMNLTHCKTINDIKYSIPKELHEVWNYYNPIPDSV